MRAWLHLRKSRHLGDPDDPQLLQTHREILTRLAREDGHDPHDLTIIQEVESGAYLGQRAEFLAALEEWERLPEGSGGVLYCMALHRLSRGDPQERGRIRVALARAGIVLRTPSGTLDLTDRTQSLLAGVQSELSEYELAEFRWRVEQTRQQKVRRGELLSGKVPFGYAWDKNSEQPVIVPNEFPVLQACCREIRHDSLRRLESRYRVPYWTLHRALRSPTICGWEARRYRSVRDRKGRLVPKRLPRHQWTWAEAPGSWPAACSRAEWEQIQVILDERAKHPLTTGNEDGWCRDVVQFVDAPAGHVRLDSSHSVGMYVLRTAEGKWGMVRRDAVNAAATQSLLMLLSSPERLVQLEAAYHSHRKAEAARIGSHDVLEGIRGEIGKARTELERSIKEALAIDGEEIRAAYRAVQRELQDEIRRLSRILDQQQAASPAEDLAGLLIELGPLAADLPALWPEVPGWIKRGLAKSLLAAVPVRLVGERGKRQAEVLEPVCQEWLSLD